MKKFFVVAYVFLSSSLGLIRVDDLHAFVLTPQKSEQIPEIPMNLTLDGFPDVMNHSYSAKVPTGEKVTIKFRSDGYANFNILYKGEITRNLMLWAYPGDGKVIIYQTDPADNMEFYIFENGRQIKLHQPDDEFITFDIVK